MNLNRRTAIKRALGIGAAAAALGVAKVASASQQGEPTSTGAHIAPPIFTPPPPDTRSPREVWQDSEDNYNKYLDRVIENPDRFMSRRIDYVSGKTYLRLKNRLIAKGITPVELVMGGDTFLVIHGNLYTIAQWW